MVRRAKLAVGNSGAHPADCHPRIGVSQVDFDLLQSPGCYETTGGRHNWALPFIGQPRRHAHQRLLGDAHVDQTVGKASLELDKFAGTNRVAAQDDDAIIGFGQLLDRRGERVPAVEQHRRGDLMVPLHTVQHERDRVALVRVGNDEAGPAGNHRQPLKQPQQRSVVVAVDLGDGPAKSPGPVG